MSEPTSPRTTEERLLEMTQQIERFLLAQCNRLEQALDAVERPPYAPSAGVGQGDCSEELERLRAEATALRAAWDKLEEQHRRFEAEEQLRERLPASWSASPGTRAESAPSAPAPPTSEAAPDAAWLQFQQLRREMQKHSSIDMPSRGGRS